MLIYARPVKTGSYCIISIYLHHIQSDFLEGGFLHVESTCYFPENLPSQGSLKKKSGGSVTVGSVFFEISLPGRHILFINAKTWHMLIKRWFNGPAHSRKPQ